MIDGVFPSAEDCAFANVLLVNKFLQSLDCAHPSRNLRLVVPIGGVSRDRITSTSWIESASRDRITSGLTCGCVPGAVGQTSTGARSTSTASS